MSKNDAPHTQFKEELRFLITISIFLIGVIYYFFTIHRAGEAAAAALGYSAFVVIFILIYGVVHKNKQKLCQYPLLLKKFTNYTVAFIASMAFWLLFLYNTDNISKGVVYLLRVFPSDIVIKIYVWFAVLITLFVFIVAPLILLIFVLNPNLYKLIRKN
ncbi:MAG: hypothetical protein KJ955_05470 [Nanoarchaeota archaeon]|nr:hypothetical protein [Nanoarchaeota archaeon]